MNESKELKTYICQFCKQSYQSDGERKPKSFRKDGSAFHYYDSTLFCSKKCCIKQLIEKRKQTYREHPEIMKQLIEKRKQTLKNHPEIREQTVEKWKQTFKNNPEIELRRRESIKRTLREHPEIIEQQKEKKKQTYKNHPEIIERISDSVRQFYENHPELRKQISEKLKQNYRDHPEIRKKQAETWKQTLKDHPEIMKKSHKKRKQTLKDHPEIIEQSRDKAYQTMKERGFTSKPEQQMIQLLKDKYGENSVIEQYRDDRYMKPNSNYHYACDCYIKSLDLFIEFNGSRFHPTEEDKSKLLQEVESFKLRYPNRDIKECQAFALLDTIENDKTKQQVAKDNNLNYLVVTDGFKELYNNEVL